MTEYTALLRRRVAQRRVTPTNVEAAPEGAASMLSR